MRIIILFLSLFITAANLFSPVAIENDDMSPPTSSSYSEDVLEGLRARRKAAEDAIQNSEPKPGNSKPSSKNTD